MGTKSKTQPEETRMLNVRVPAEMIDRFRIAAEASHRTVSQELRRLIEERILEHEGGTP